MEANRRSFFWGESQESNYSTRKLHTIRRDMLCARKENGGLGLGNLERKNIALLAKWCWKFRKDKKKLWHNFVTGKYGDLTSTSTNPRVQLSPFMIAIANLSKTIYGTVFQNSEYKWCLKNGESIDFWNDNWHQNGVLKTLFPRLYQLAVTKSATVKTFISSWNPLDNNLWRRPLRGWEVEATSNLSMLISRITLHAGQDVLNMG